MPHRHSSQSSFHILTQAAVRLACLAAGLVILILFTAHKGLGAAGLLAFASDRTGNSDIYLFDISHSLAYNLTHSPADDLGPVWSSRVGEFAFYSDRDGNGATEIYRMQIDGSAVQRIAAEPGTSWRPEWSPDGQQILFIRNYGDIHIMNADGNYERGLIYGFAPVWSPAAPQIAFYADRRGDLNADIYVVDADGKNLRNLTQNPAHDWDPAWSPDGSQIAFVSSRDGNAEIYVMPVDCPAECPTQRLTFNPAPDRAPSWSPDGQSIAYEIGTPPGVGIAIIPVTGGQPQIIDSTAANDHTPVWLAFLDN